MSDDITDALRGFAESQRRAADASPPDQRVETASLTRRVSRRRAARAGSVAVTAVAVVGGVVVGAILSGSRAPTPPALPAPTTVSPSTSAPTPTPTVTPTTPPTPSVWTLHAAEPMAPGMLDATDADWRLVRYGSWDATGEEPLAPETGYLLDPDGRPFVVPTASDPAEWYLMDWLPGSSLVVTRSVADGVIRVVDLLTGESRAPLGTGFGEVYFVGDGTTDVVLVAGGVERRLIRLSADGVTRSTTATFGYQYGSLTAIPSLDGSRIVVNDVAGPRVVTDGLTPLTSLTPYPDRPDACRAWAWVDDVNVLVECATGGGAAFGVGSPSEFWLAPADGGTARLLVGVPEATRLGGVWRFGDRLVAGTFGPTEAAAGWWEITDDGVVPLSSGGDPGLWIVDVRGAELIAVQYPRSETGGPVVVSLVAIDPVRGSIRRLVDGDPAGMASMAVVRSPFVGAPQTHTGD